MKQIDLAIATYRYKVEALEERLNAERESLIDVVKGGSYASITSRAQRLEQLEKELQITEEFLRTLMFLQEDIHDEN